MTQWIRALVLPRSFPTRTYAMASGKSTKIDYLTLISYLTELRIAVYDLRHIDCKFNDTERLGSGNSMTVYRAHFTKDPGIPNSKRIPVAIKVPNVTIKDMNRDNKAASVLNDVRQELRMMKHFEKHPNIINLYGIIFQDLKPMMIVELAEDKITSFLADKKEKNETVDWDTKARFCCEVADGLRALHISSVVHGDLKGDNILLFIDPENNGELIAKITDFGYSATEASIKRGGGTGGTRYFLAPECTFSASADMKKYANDPRKDNYSFGLFVWQVAKDGEIPYEDMEDMDEDIDKIKNSDKELSELMNQLPDDTPECFKTVIAAMTKYSPEERADLVTVREMMGLDKTGDERYFIKLFEIAFGVIKTFYVSCSDGCIDYRYAAAKEAFEKNAKELPRDVAKAKVLCSSMPYFQNKKQI